MGNMATDTASAATGKGIKVRGADFVLYWISDMERSLRFYKGFLGMSEGSNWGNEWVELDAAPTTLALVRVGASGSNDPVTTGKRAPSIYLAVEDVRDAIGAARAAGYTVVVEPDEGEVCISAVILDPDGNAIGLHTRKDGTWG
jgi:catechol 2,3-dioxygenase-like lactoylglutathione lyase family enzyme